MLFALEHRCQKTTVKGTLFQLCMLQMSMSTPIVTNVSVRTESKYFAENVHSFNPNTYLALLRRGKSVSATCKLNHPWLLVLT